MRDEWFVRGDAPMTKEEVRAVSLSKLELKEDSILLDIGAGTGSVSVEAALCFHVKKIFAFEKKKEASELLRQNRKKAGISEETLTLIEGTVPDSLPEFSKKPTHAFIGGTSGNMKEILIRLSAINSDMRIVVNVIALETLSELVGLLKEHNIEADIVSVQVAKARCLGSYHLMQGQNPVYVISFGGRDVL